MITKADRKYLSQLKIRYKRANKPQRIIILDEFTKTLGYDSNGISVINDGAFAPTS